MPEKIHKVVAGENLHVIARRWKVSLKDLVDTNKLDPKKPIQPGLILKKPETVVPVSRTSPVSVQQPEKTSPLSQLNTLLLSMTSFDAQSTFEKTRDHLLNQYQGLKEQALQFRTNAAIQKSTSETSQTVAPFNQQIKYSGSKVFSINAFINPSTEHEQPVLRPPTFFLQGGNLDYQNYTSPKLFSDHLDQLKASGINTLSLHYQPIYKKDSNGNITLVNGSQLQTLKLFIRLCHQKNIHAIVRFEVFKDAGLAKIAPELSIQNEKYDKWIDFSNPALREIRLGMIAQIMTLGADEVQLDYIRAPEGTTTDKGFYYQNLIRRCINQKNYSAENIAALKDFGIPESEIKTYTSIPNVNHYGVESFLAKVQQLKTKSGYTGRISAAFFPTAVMSKVDSQIIGQRPAEMARYVDALYPMIYPSHFYNWENKYANAAQNTELIVTKLQEQMNENKTSALIIPYVEAIAWEKSVVGKMSANQKRDFIKNLLKAQLSVLNSQNSSGWLGWHGVGNLQAVTDALNNSKNTARRVQSKASNR